MKIEITKTNAKTLRTAIWLLTQTCNRNRPDNNFEFNDKIAAELQVTLNQLAKLNELSGDLRETFKLD